MKIKNKNRLIFFLENMFYSCANLLATGTVIQTFMLEIGINESKVSFYISAMQVIQTLIMLLISKAVENIKNVFSGLAVAYSAYIPFFAVMLYLCISNGITLETKYIIIFIVGFVLNSFYGVISTLSYKLPHKIMDIKNYGSMIGQSGVISGIACILITAVMSLFIEKFSYFSVMSAVSIAGIVFGFLAVVLCFMFTPISNEIKGNSDIKINIFKYKPFYQLIIPNFMRGFNYGIVNLITVIGYYCNILDSDSASIVAIITHVAMLLSSQSYVFLAKKCANGLLCLISSVIVCIVAPFMVLTGIKSIFYILYFVIFLFVNYISISIPVLVAEKIDYNCLGQYTAWRMALFTFGIGAGGVVVPLLLKYVGAIGTLVVCGIAVLPCGIGYYMFERQSKIQEK